jgi:hypothetical protein
MRSHRKAHPNQHLIHLNWNKEENMRTLKMLLALTLIAALAVPVFGQRTPGSFSIGGFGGLTMPQSPKEFKDNLKSGIGFGGEFKYNINEKTSFVAAFSVLPFKFNEDQIAKMLDQELGETGIGVNVTGGGVNINAITANILLYLTQPEASTGFYATAGGGYYMHKFKNPTKVEFTYQGETIDITDNFNEGSGSSSNNENKFGINGGLGLEIAIGSSAALFAEGKYHLIFTEGDKTGLITVMGGLRFSLQ